MSTVLSPFLYPFFWRSQQLPEANVYFSPSGLTVQISFPFTSIIFLFFLSHLSGTAFTSATDCLNQFNPEEPLCDISPSNIPASTFFPHQCHHFLGFHDLMLSGLVPSFVYGCSLHPCLVPPILPQLRHPSVCLGCVPHFLLMCHLLLCDATSFRFPFECWSNHWQAAQWESHSIHLINCL